MRATLDSFFFGRISTVRFCHDYPVIFKADNLIKMAEEEEGKSVTFASLVRLCVMYGNFQGFARNIMQGMRIFKV